MANYVQGGFNDTESSYNLLISGAPKAGNKSSSIYLGADTTTVGNGTRFMFNNETQNAAIDLRATDITKNITFRYTTNGNAMANMLTLANDTAMSNNTTHAATVGGRVNASAFYVNGSLSDTRAPTSVGMYMGLDSTTVAQFNVNKGAGTGGFAFNTYNTDGTLNFNNMNLKSNGQVQTVYYNATGAAADNEAVAIAGFDSNGNLVRNYAANQRFRLAESRLGQIECNLQNYVGQVPSKINEIISRLNGLNFFSSNINNVAIWSPVTTTV
jgi:hypothetical protein